jgi:hypothetical protein
MLLYQQQRLFRGKCAKLTMAMDTRTDATGRSSDSAEPAFWSWFGFWSQFLVLGLLAVVGAFVASADARPGDYLCGLLLSLVAVMLAFLRLKHWLDGGASGWGEFLFVNDMKQLAIVIPLFAVIGLCGLFIAHAWESGAMHAAGLGLFVASGAIIFLNIKRVFDRMDAGTH